jgi:hypothetical protein
MHKNKTGYSKVSIFKTIEKYLLTLKNKLQLFTCMFFVVYNFTCSPWQSCYICLPGHGQSRYESTLQKRASDVGFPSGLDDKIIEANNGQQRSRGEWQFNKCCNPQKGNGIPHKVLILQVTKISILNLAGLKLSIFCINGQSRKYSACKANALIKNLLHRRSCAAICILLMCSGNSFACIQRNARTHTQENDTSDKFRWPHAKIWHEET